MSSGTRLHYGYRWYRWQECKRKKDYGGEKKAREAINAKGLEGTLIVYHCPFCRGWHIGHPRTTKDPMAVKKPLVPRTPTLRNGHHEGLTPNTQSPQGEGAGPDSGRPLTGHGKGILPRIERDKTPDISVLTPDSTQGGQPP